MLAHGHQPSFVRMSLCGRQGSLPGNSRSRHRSIVVARQSRVVSHRSVERSPVHLAKVLASSQPTMLRTVTVTLHDRYSIVFLTTLRGPKLKHECVLRPVSCGLGVPDTNRRPQVARSVDRWVVPGCSGATFWELVALYHGSRSSRQQRLTFCPRHRWHAVVDSVFNGVLEDDIWLSWRRASWKTSRQDESRSDYYKALKNSSTAIMESLWASS